LGKYLELQTKTLYDKLNKAFFTSNSRNALILRNISLSSILKLGSIGISFIVVPITLSYLSKIEYGLWTALSSVLSWFFIFDIGIGNGLRNKITELKAKNQISEIKSLVSTAYFIFCILALIIIIVFIILNCIINWSNLLNSPKQFENEINKTAQIVFVNLTIIFVIKLFNNILYADLKQWIGDLFTLISSLISLIGIILLKKLTAPSLVYYALIYTNSTLFVNLIGSCILFSTIYKNYSPNFRTINLRLRNQLVSVGFKFFFLQIGSLVLFQTSGIILSNLVGPESVVDYNITLKYYSMSTMLFMFLWQPLWTAFGDAYYKHDYNWIRKTISRLKKCWIGITIIMFVMLAMQKFVFKLWLNNKIEVNYTLSLLFIVFYSLQMWQTIYETFINSTSKLKLSVTLASILIPLYIPTTIFFVKYLGLGAIGLLISTILINDLPGTIIKPIQSKKILDNKRGIWSK